MSCQLGRPRTGGACAVCLHGTSFPPLVLGSGTPNLSPRSRRRRAPSGATALPEARLRTFPRTLRRTAAARGREPVEDPRAEEPGESALLPSLPHSPPRSLPPSPRMFRYEVSVATGSDPSLPPAPLFLSHPPRAGPVLLGREVGGAGEKEERAGYGSRGTK
jgi:hypothetical protein